MKKTLEDKQAELKSAFTNKKLKKAQKSEKLHRSDRIAASNESNSHIEKKKQASVHAPLLDWQERALVMEAAGKTNAEIAEIVKRNPTTVYRFLKSDKAAEGRKGVIGVENIKELKDRFRELGMLAISAAKELLEDTDPNLKVQRAAKGLEILSMLGVKEGEKKDIRHIHIHEAVREGISRGAKRAIEEKKEKETNTTAVGTA